MAAEGMKFHYDVTGAEPIIRDIRVYNVGALLKGTAMASGPVATAENTGGVIVADSDVLSNIVGLLMEDMTAAQCLGVVATGVDKYAKILINPFAVYLAKYSTHADDDEVTTTTTSKILTQTMITDHERGWAYITNTGSSVGGFGNLFQIGASGTTATITAATSYDDNLSAVTLANVDTFITLVPPYSADVAGYGVDLSEATGQISMQLAGYETTAGAGAAIVLENYITSSFRPMEPLVCAKHSGYNYKSENPKFYGDVMFPEHVLCNGGGPNARVID
jgi:hypothetical protein